MKVSLVEQFRLWFDNLINCNSDTTLPEPVMSNLDSLPYIQYLWPGQYDKYMRTEKGKFCQWKKKERPSHQSMSFSFLLADLKLAVFVL